MHTKKHGLEEGHVGLLQDFLGQGNYYSTEPPLKTYQRVIESQTRRCQASIYWRNELIFANLERHNLPLQISITLELQSQDQLTSDLSRPPAEWHPVQCWHGALWWRFEVALEKRHALEQRNSPLSSRSPLYHLEQWFSLLGSMLKKEKYG